MQEAPGLTVAIPSDMSAVETETQGLARIAGLAMQTRLSYLLAGRHQPLPFLLAAELVTSHLISLPPATPRQRAAMLAFAAEERIAAPLDTTLVAPGPETAVPDAPQLSFIVDRRVMAACPLSAPRILPEYLLIPRPLAGWAVWRDGDRCIVRSADGTGFAASSGMLALLWARAKRPEVTSYGDTLPDGVPGVDRSHDVPLPDPRELAYGLPRERPGDTARTWRPIFVAVVLLMTGLAAHLVLLAADVAALHRIAERERDIAQTSIEGPLPGVTVTVDVSPILQRLAPAVPASTGSALLPLLADVSTALAAADATSTFRRLAWGASDNLLVVLVQTSGLEALQNIERGLTEAGFTVQSGAASAGDGGAEVEMRISRRPA